jgi:hypothetical protein
MNAGRRNEQITRFFRRRLQDGEDGLGILATRLPRHEPFSRDLLARLYQIVEVGPGKMK